MIKAKNPIKLREIIIAAVIACAIFVVGAVLDFRISQKIYDPSSTNIFGLIISGIAELPVCIALSVGGIGLIVRPRNKKAEVWFVILGVLALVASTYFAFSTVAELSEFETVKKYKTVFYVIGIILAIVLEGGIILFGIKKFKKYDSHNLFVVSLTLIIMAAATAAIVEGTKFLWSRPRPYYVYSYGSAAETEYHPFWQLNPFGCLTQKISEPFTRDTLKSFASGHTAYASLGMFVLPMVTLLSPKYKEDRKLQIILFYVGLLWALIAAFSRVLVGMHFVSDVGGGMIIAIVVGIITLLVLFKEKKQVVQTNE